ncbi:ArsR/SmtB family transcription factor [Goodfellowiella coeruleoviolacea]|uniref:Helix-turn-helix domain-containing protein n=1 Tax=Goodfellowiella coeruleoviolacea TaxID=334858 RepID=A0AAE3GLV0_9PSEU|nr:winged helix-turn-helix domain-containing protein [Goodfellowiella coeruleoviolacea]MCP2169674.1 Helix-turn-helix domain-containing protein [Goodfellowiella coeruleoviolacea]
MLRIFFTPEDLTRIRIITGPHPLWELLLSLNRIRRGDGAEVFGEWRRRIRPQVPASTRLLSDLAPPSGYAVDFLTPVTPTPSLAQGLAALRRTPRQRIDTDLSHLAAERPLPDWTRALSAGDPAGLDQLAVAANQYFAACLAPYWQQVHAHVDHERARLVRLIADGGYERVLRELHPSARWRPPVLDLDYPVDRELHLAGRGLLLVPSFFCFGMPITFRDSSLPPTLVLPIDHESGWVAGEVADTARALVALLGRTRARVLAAIGDGGCTTSELARRVGTSLATASQHASVLRQARLINSKQHGQAVLHSITTLGRALVESGTG